MNRFKASYPSMWPPPVGITSGKDAEAECYTVEYFFLKKVGASQDILDRFSDWVFSIINIRIPIQ